MRLSVIPQDKFNYGAIVETASERLNHTFSVLHLNSDL